MRNLFAILVFLPMVSFAGVYIGNGGDAVVRGEKQFLLDLVEFGVEENPKFNIAKSSASFVILENVELSNLVEQKLQDIETQEPFFGRLMRDKLQSLQWILVDAELKPVDDVQTPIDADIVQVASRRDGIVRISRQANLDIGNLLALVTHEIIYDISEKQGDSQSQRARKANAYLFLNPLKISEARRLIIGEKENSEYEGCTANFGSPLFKDIQTISCNYQCPKGQEPRIVSKFENENTGFRFQALGRLAICSWFETDLHKSAWQVHCPDGHCPSHWQWTYCQLDCVDSSF